MSLALLFHYLMLNMFRTLIHPTSRACDLFVELFHCLYCSVRIEVFALAYLFSAECLVVTCVVVLVSVFLQILAAAVSYGYWVFFVCSLFFDDVFWIYFDVKYMSLHIPDSMCVGVTLWFGWGGVVSGCRLKHSWYVHVGCGGWGLMAVWNMGFISPGLCSGMSLPSWWRDWIYGKVIYWNRNWPMWWAKAVSNLYNSL